ncbi:MAG TPA: hypothetical protein VLA74_10370 [Nitrososphaeraceae archaeon]|nr:hypothetical protein [Nitrososphaeraceae archaeon]
MNAAASQPQPSQPQPSKPQPSAYTQPYTYEGDDYEQESQSLNESAEAPEGDPSGDPKDHSTSGSPDDSKDPAKRAAEKFPETWAEDEPHLHIYFIASVDDATWITQEIYKEIDKGTIAASLYIEKSENSIIVDGSIIYDGPMISRSKDENAYQARANLIKRIKEKLKSIFGL